MEELNNTRIAQKQGNFSAILPYAHKQKKVSIKIKVHISKEVTQ